RLEPAVIMSALALLVSIGALFVAIYEASVSADMMTAGSRRPDAEPWLRSFMCSPGPPRFCTHTIGDLGALRSACSQALPPDRLRGLSSLERLAPAL
ncbi:MAG: hypothetical protein AAFX85_19695, partial [Pseudomonadota bacterium]